MKNYGLIGKSLSHSFSPKYFKSKFLKEGISDCDYSLFELNAIEEIKGLIEGNANLKGLNVTSPFKAAVIPYLDEVDEMSKSIKAVNTIKIDNGKTTGTNSDVYGFKRSLAAVLKSHHERALIFGTGGASKAVCYVLDQLGVDYKMVSRTPTEGQFSYEELNKYVFKHFTLLINSTPLGMFPKTETCPEFDYSFLSENHLLYDLIYNPSQTLFMKKGAEYGAQTLNGERMLQLQAEKSWEFWNS